jgi:hypothetical protein
MNPLLKLFQKREKKYPSLIVSAPPPEAGAKSSGSFGRDPKKLQAVGMAVGKGRTLSREVWDPAAATALDFEATLEGRAYPAAK